MGTMRRWKLVGILFILSMFLLSGMALTGSVQAQSEKGPYDTLLIHGTIYNRTEEGEYTPLEDYRIEVSRQDFIPRYNISDVDGKFEIWVPPSDQAYKITVRNTDGDIVKSRQVRINTTTPFEFDAEIDLSEEDDDEDSIIDWGSILDFLLGGWYWIVFCLLVLVGGVVAIGLTFTWFEKIEKKEKVSEAIITPIKRFTLAILLVIFASAEYAFIALLFNLPWSVNKVALKVIIPIFMIILVFIILKILLEVLKYVIAYYRKKLEQKEENLVYSRILLILEFIIKYIIILLAALLVLTIILVTLGFEDLIIIRAMDFLITNSGAFMLLGLLIIIAISVQRFSQSFFSDLKVRPGAKKMTPGMMFILEKAVKYGLTVLIIMIAIFTVLSAMGLGEIGQTIILMISMIIGFVVSMAATGSIGNALSGLVIYGFKPLEKGDLVSVATGEGQLIGTVRNIDLMFTTLEDLESKVIRVPNNVVLGSRIVNHSKSEPEGFAVVIEATIGYDVPAELVKDLMKEAALETPGVLKDPKPFVLLTEFHNHAIGYKLRAYIDNAKAQFATKSAIMRIMQKKFHRAGVEILSPLYHVKREETMPTSDTIKKKQEYAEKIQDSDVIQEVGAEEAFAGFAVMEQMDSIPDAPVSEVKKEEPTPPLEEAPPEVTPEPPKDETPVGKPAPKPRKARKAT